MSATNIAATSPSVLTGFGGEGYIAGAEGVDVAFAGKRDRAAREPALLDARSAASSIFGREGLRFSLPASLLADVEGALRVADPVFHLTHRFTDAARGTLLKPAKVYRKEGEGHRAGRPTRRSPRRDRHAHRLLRHVRRIP